MLVSHDPHFLDGTSLRSTGCVKDSQCTVDQSTEEYIRISETEVVTKTHVLHNLHQMGLTLFNNPQSSNTCLHIQDQEGESAAFWVHDFYFIHDSPVLYRTIHRTPHLHTPILDELEQFNPNKEQITFDCAGRCHIHLSVPCVNGFKELLQWIYTHDDDQWVMSMTEDNFDSIMSNVAFLRLSQDAYYVMAEFYETI
ncbi:hypothetical protein K493DRAFT_310538 [Basidiobolus meristosporus CBS 931.73]|uniref:BTB domain-containing protein n=1 Tax=Basidiobolus meristosporus CBS 931.73 TaxID=1314790 RepID=A0A1Y1Z8L8_9FUNG|nr:hypothetical protein K493DRAFT_310538 [Basidiobolus meristosporus CBS 931.73]|eukprot:ORY06601.1 hypothetical protein K493DRAFT_310538 [Basidiobolus meristosporus CBS 931.73]